MARSVRSDISRLIQQDAAALLDVTARTLRDWADAPRNKDGTYPGPALVAWYTAKKSGVASGEFEDQRQRLAAAQAEKHEHENAVRRGDLAPRAEVVRFWSDCIANMRAKALGLGPKLGPQLVNIADASLIAAAIRAEVYAFLAELAEYEPGGHSGVVEGGEEDRGPAADADGQRVGGPRTAPKQRKQRGAGAVAD